MNCLDFLYISGSAFIHLYKIFFSCLNSYIVAGGILEPDEDGFYDMLDDHDPYDSAQRVFAFARDILRCSTLVSSNIERSFFNILPNFIRATHRAKCAQSPAGNSPLSVQVAMPHTGQPVSIRIGIHTGPCVR